MSQRTDKINSLIQEELSQIMAREIEFPQGTLVTIIDVDTAGDLKTAKVYISVLPFNHCGTAIETIKKNIGEIQRLLNRTLHMRFIPRLEFKIDSTEEEASHVDALLDKI